MRAKLRKLLERVVDPQLSVGRDHRDTNLLVADGRDIDLAATAPVEFHKIGPGREAIAAPEAEAWIFTFEVNTSQAKTSLAESAQRLSIELGPSANARTAAISADHPTGAHQFSGKQRAFRMKPSYRRPPHHPHSAG